MKKIINFILELLGFRVKSNPEKKVLADEKTLQDEIEEIREEIKELEENKKKPSLEDEIKYWEIK